MADKKGDKKGDKKDDKKDSAVKTGEEIFVFALLVFFGIFLLMKAIDFFKPSPDGTGVTNSKFEIFTGGANGWYANFLHFLNSFVSGYITVATIFSIICGLAILYVAWLTHQLKVEDKKRDMVVDVAENSPSLQSQKWERVLAHANSQNPAEWRLSILEADVMLDDMMQHIGFHGDTLGERLKNAPKGDFKTINIAWEAHKIRNAIAHEGSDFLLSQRESKRIIGLYETVFKEFSYV